MAIKIHGQSRGENPQEQFKLERKRFEMKQKHKTQEQGKRREELLKAGEGNQKLI
ncbi:hypothetical protein ES703_103555 [subsurface metagenome]